MKKSARMLVLFKEMNGTFDAILEYVQDIPEIRARATRLEGKVDQLQEDMAIVKFGLKMHSEQIAELQARS